MYIGIIAEGKSDLAVIANILKGKLGIEKSDVQYLQPELAFDETDLANMRPEQYSNWGLVRRTCLEKDKFCDFFKIDEDRFIIIQIDTAEAEEIHYDVKRPGKQDNSDYSSQLRSKVIDKINEWLENQFADKVFYAIAIEETEAWLLTIYSDRQSDTSKYNDPKAVLYQILNKKFSKKQQKTILSLKNELEKFDILSKDFRKSKNLNKYIQRNESLRLFCHSLDSLPK